MTHSGPKVLFQDLRREEIRGWWWWYYRRMWKRPPAQSAPPAATGPMGQVVFLLIQHSHSISVAVQAVRIAAQTQMYLLTYLHTYFRRRLNQGLVVAIINNH